MTSTWAGVIFVGSLIAALALVHRPLGDYMARVLTTTRHLAVERVIYRVGGIDPDAEQTLGTLPAVGAGLQRGVDRCSCTGFLRLQHAFLAAVRGAADDGRPGR